MYNFEIFTDSTSDLTKELREQYHVNYVPMNVVINGEELEANLDWEKFGPVEYYNLMRKGTKVKTSQVPMHVYEKAFTEVLEAKKDVLYLACSSKLSGSINFAKVVAEELKAKYPERKIYCIDTLRSTLAEGLIVCHASNMREEGKSIDEIAQYIEENKLCWHTIATVESLNYLKNAGRVKAGAAFFGNIFGVKPIIIADAIGNNYALKKVKGRRSSLLEVINMVKESVVNPQDQYIAIEHADCDVDLEFVKEHIMNELKPKGVIINYVGPIIGATVGPGTIIVSFFGTKETIVGNE